jgi:hypothetical protein
MYKKNSYRNIIEIPEGYNEIISPLERIALFKKHKDKFNAEPKRILFTTTNSVLAHNDRDWKKNVLKGRIVDSKNSWEGYHHILDILNYTRVNPSNNLECAIDGYKKNNGKIFEKFIGIDLELLKVNKKLVEEEKNLIERKGCLNNENADLLKKEEDKLRERKLKEIKNYIISMCNPNHKSSSEKELNRRIKRIVAAELIRQFYPVTEEFLNLYYNGKIRNRRIILK